MYRCENDCGYSAFCDPCKENDPHPCNSALWRFNKNCSFREIPIVPRPPFTGRLPKQRAGSVWGGMTAVSAQSVDKFTVEIRQSEPLLLPLPPKLGTVLRLTPFEEVLHGGQLLLHHQSLLLLFIQPERKWGMKG